MANEIIKLAIVISITGLSGSSIYRLAAQNQFPKPIKLSSRSSGWLKLEVSDWIDERIKASRLEARGLTMTIQPKRISFRTAINAKCKDCIYDPKEKGTWRKQVEHCTITTCSLHTIRPLPIK
jgi:prophage regulatory protein